MVNVGIKKNVDYEKAFLNHILRLSCINSERLGPMESRSSLKKQVKITDSVLLTVLMSCDEICNTNHVLNNRLKQISVLKRLTDEFNDTTGKYMICTMMMYG